MEKVVSLLVLSCSAMEDREKAIKLVEEILMMVKTPDFPLNKQLKIEHQELGECVFQFNLKKEK